MKTWRFIVLALLLTLTGTALAAENIQWQSYEEGIEQGKIRDKKIFLHFYADWCKYCKVMAEKTFTDEDVIGYLNSNYVSIRVDTQENGKIAREYKVSGLPSNWFIAADGKKIGNQPGYLDADRLLDILEYVHTESFKAMSFRDFLKNQPDR